MDWLKGMNDVLKFIEDNLSQPILYESLSKIAGCSVYEFSRIFSFMAGIPYVDTAGRNAGHIAKCIANS